MILVEMAVEKNPLGRLKLGGVSYSKVSRAGNKFRCSGLFKGWTKCGPRKYTIPIDWLVG